MEDGNFSGFDTLLIAIIFGVLSVIIQFAPWIMCFEKSYEDFILSMRNE